MRKEAWPVLAKGCLKMKLRCRLGFCNDLRREIHVTEMMPKNAYTVKAAVIHKCNKCGCTKMKTGRPMETEFVVPDQYQ